MEEMLQPPPNLAPSPLPAFSIPNFSLLNDNVKYAHTLTSLHKTGVICVRESAYVHGIPWEAQAR